MSTNSEQESTKVESSDDTTVVETQPTDDQAATDNPTNVPTTVETETTNTGSSWFSSLPIPSNLTSQFSTFSTSFFQVTSKVSAAATTLVQKTLPQRPSTPVEDQATEGTTENQSQTTEENKTDNDTGASAVPTIDLTSILSDLSSTVIKSAQQLKQAVEEKSLLGNFSKEHEKFLNEKRTQQRREEAAVAPWVGYIGEEEMKKQIMELSKEKRNFLRSPPPGANFHFELSAMYPIALATLEVDENLKAMRFELVPKQINEESFWCNYFYRVSLVKQSTQLSALTQESASSASKETQQQQNQRDRTTSESQDKHADTNQEFVSEDYESSTVNMDEIRREIEELTEAKKTTAKNQEKASGSLDDGEWDKSLVEDLENVSAEELEAQINQMLAADNK